MPARKPDQRKGKTTIRINFNLGKEAKRLRISPMGGMDSGGKPALILGNMRGTHRRAFSATREVPGAELIGSIKIRTGPTTYWYVSKRKRTGTVRDRKK